MLEMEAGICLLCGDFELARVVSAISYFLFGYHRSMN